VAKETADLLPVPYFHLVFTMPGQLVGLSQQNQRVLYDILFAAGAEALTTIAADPRHLGVEIGFLAVLHTWGQNLQAHPHIHCIVPGGGLSSDGKNWVGSRENFFLSVKVLSRLYRGLFVSRLRTAYENDELEFHGRLAELAKPKRFDRLLRELSDIEWVVYAKRPFGGPKQVVSYLGRYTHRVAISNHRLVSDEGGKVRFRWKDYRRAKSDNESGTSIMELDAHEFIRRFLLHVLPRGFVRIRRYGLLANRKRGGKLAKCRELLGTSPGPPIVLGWETLFENLTGRSATSCRHCQHGQLTKVREIPSFKDLLERLGPRVGLYLPSLRLSRILGAHYLEKVRLLESALPSSPAANRPIPNGLPKLDTS
tara:strand:+ start:1843 stop:2946 length:1104 start_codon:yes stop_codon:yes gene_type:complete